jgi:hypothetical protein
MRISSITKLVNFAFSYVLKTSELYRIDESHSVKHALEVYDLANKIYTSEINTHPYIKYQEDIIFTSAILHDMCDKKYMNETEGIIMMKEYMSDYMDLSKLDVVDEIISTMSYSKVKIKGYPDLGEYQLAYHIVREADLLSAYDIDRCIIYGMYVEKLDYISSVKRAINLFESRVLKYRTDNLFITNFSKLESIKRHIKSVDRLNELKSYINKNIC